ncbi:MAG: hypothetical protein Q7S77_01165, partial [Candidatus Staskawiczbacteria bacterium]|nr:hypothetical protein [Candidatus Staskawiczbacteria bacterium]
WSTAAGACTGTGDGAVPGSSHTATFTIDCVNNATINANFSVSALTIDSGYTGIITQNDGATITIASTSTGWTQSGGTFTGNDTTTSAITFNYGVPFNLSGGTFNAPPGTLTIGGDLTVTGTFNAGTGTVKFSGNWTPVARFTSGEQTFYNVTIDMGSPSSGVTVDKDAAVTTCNPPDGSEEIVTWEVNGTLTLGNKAFTLSHHCVFSTHARGPVVVLSTHDGGGGIGNPELSGVSNAQDYRNDILYIDGTGDQSFTIPAGAAMKKTVLNNASTTISTSGTGDITFLRKLSVTAGTFDASASSANLVFKSSLEVNGGTFTGGSGTVSVTDGVTLSSGTLTAPSSTLTLTIFDADDLASSLVWTHTGGTFNHNSGTVTITGTGYTVSGTTAFNNFTINHAGTTTLGAALDLADTLTLTAGTLDVSGTNYGITAKSWTDTGAGTFTEGTGTVTFDVTGGTINSNDAFNSVTVNHAGTTTLGADTTISGALTLTAGTLSASTYTITLSGTGTVFSNSGTYTAGTSTISLTDTSSSSKTFAGGGGTYNNLSITGAGTGAVIFTGSNTFNDFTINPPKTVTFTSSTTQTISGTFSCSGTSGNVITLASTSASASTLSKSSGTVGCDYISVSYSTATGGATWNAGDNSTDGGNNTGWQFTVAATSSSSAPKPPSGVGEYIETIAEIPEKIAEIPEAIVEGAKRIAEQVANIQKQLADLIRPKQEKPTEIVTVPEEAQLSLQNEWNLLPVKEIQEFVLSPLPAEIKMLAQKFPQLKKTFEDVGITKITDIEKLKDANLKIPGLTQSIGLSQIEISPGKFSPPKGVPIDKLLSVDKQKIPSEIVFAKTGGGLVDINTTLSINNKGEAEQTIKTISGQSLQLVVKPDKQVKRIKGYIIFRSKTPTPTAFQIPLNYLTASLVFASPNLTKNQEEPIKTEEKLVLAEFEYQDTSDGVYVATINVPVVDGEYEIITVMDYEDENIISKEIRLITVIDPEGYIYEKNGNNETRILGAVASIYWLNPETNQYEIWNAKDYQQENPQTTDERGTYSFLVPEGEYYLKVDAQGYSSYDGKPFQVSGGSGVHINIELKNKNWLTKIVNWKSILFIVVILLLLYNFYRDKIREKIIAQSKV